MDSLFIYSISMPFLIKRIKEVVLKAHFQYIYEIKNVYLKGRKGAWHIAFKFKGCLYYYLSVYRRKLKTFIKYS